MYREYFVIRRGTEWWVSGWNGRVGPYVSRDAAQQAAIAEAKKDYRNHLTAKVFVEEGLVGGISLVYDSALDREAMLECGVCFRPHSGRLMFGGRFPRADIPARTYGSGSTMWTALAGIVSKLVAISN